MTLPPSPTVVVARRVRPEHETAFAEWARRVQQAAARFPGHRGADVQPPGPDHPGEWVIVYRFEDPVTLETWLRSPERTALLEEAEPMLLGPAREQVVAVAAAAPVTVVVSQQVREGRQSEFRALHREVAATLARFAGFVRVELFEPVPGVQNNYVIVFTFDSREHLDAWLGSAERAAWLERVAELIEGDRSLSVVGGFGGWFPARAPGAAEPRRWKQAAAVLLALYPTVLVLGAVQNALLPDLPRPLAVLIGNVATVAALTWLLMPRVTAWLHEWLRR